MTNAWKASVIAAVNAVITFVEAFGFYDFTDEQTNAIYGLWNIGALIYVLATYKNSPNRIPDSLR